MVITVRKVMFLILLLVFVPSVINATGLGIWPAEVNVTVLPLKTSYTSIYLYNPSGDDIDVDLSYDYYGKYLPKDQFKFAMHPSKITVKKNTSMYEPEEVKLIIRNPLFIRNDVKLKIIGKEINIPTFRPIIGKTGFEGRVKATTVTKPMSIVLTSKTNVEITGFNGMRVMTIGLLITLAILLKLYFGIKKE